MRLKFYSKFFIALLVLANTAFAVSAQYTEDFEAITPSGQAFTSNGQGFTVTNALKVNTVPSGLGYQGSQKYLENTAPPGQVEGQTNSIFTDGGALINVKSLYLLTSADSGVTASNDGSIRFVGKRLGVTQFTVTKTSGFLTTIALPANGYTFVNFATEDAQNVTAYPIDQLEITLQGHFDYFSIDNFTWSFGVLPVNLVAFNAILQNNQAHINWRTAGEINNSHFTIEKSTNGTDFTLLKTIQGKGTYGNPSDYSVVDESPENGRNYYRLKQYDFDGRVKDHGVKTIVYNGNSESFRTYPNPVINNVFTLETNGSVALGQFYKIVDMSGRVLLYGKITQNKQPINISDIQKGMFILQIADGRFIKMIKN